MSLRQQNLGSIIKPGFNPLGAQTTTYTYYLWSWGANSNGQLGIGNATDYSSPKQVGSLTDWVTPSVGGFYAQLAVKSDGTLWAWGYGGYGQLGLGNRTNYSSPKQVGALTNWLQVAAAQYHVWAVKTDGTLWSWGTSSGTFGAMGLNNNTGYSSPKQVGSLTTWASVSVAISNSYARKTDGTIWSCGEGANGALGTNSATNVSSPVQIGALTTWAVVQASAGGQGYAFGLKTDGTLWAWGLGSNGSLGIGNTLTYSSPKQIGALTTWAKIANNGNTAAAIRTDGTLWAWGYNLYGQIGNSSTANTSSPVQVGSGTWSSVSSGNNVAVGAIKSDGTLWTWGRNDFGTLGLGNTTAYSSPKQVGSDTNWSRIVGDRSSFIALKV